MSYISVRLISSESLFQNERIPLSCDKSAMLIFIPIVVLSGSDSFCLIFVLCFVPTGIKGRGGAFLIHSAFSICTAGSEHFPSFFTLWLITWKSLIILTRARRYSTDCMLYRRCMLLYWLLFNLHQPPCCWEHNQPNFIINPY